MVRRVLANSSGHDIEALFESEEEYRRFCEAVTEECISVLMKNTALEEIIRLWQKKNGIAIQ